MEGLEYICDRNRLVRTPWVDGVCWWAVPLVNDSKQVRIPCIEMVY